MVAKGEGEDSIIKWRVLNDRPNTIDRTATPRKGVRIFNDSLTEGKQLCGTRS